MASAREGEPLETGSDAFGAVARVPARRPCSVIGALRGASATLAEAGCDTPRLDAELLLMEALGWSREDVYRSPEAALGASALERFAALVDRRARAEPVAYLRGMQEFWSLEFTVTHDVLIPRPETEHLVEAVVNFLAARPGRQRVLDLGTGSGAIAVSVARECARAEVWATDVSAAALAVAQENGRRHGVESRIRWLQGDLFTALGESELPGAALRGTALGRPSNPGTALGTNGGVSVNSAGAPADFDVLVDVLVSNPPYIPSQDLARLPRDVGQWEPVLALDGGADGMDFYRRIVREGTPRLRQGGLLAVEVGDGLAGPVAALFRAHGELRRVRVLKDYAGRARVVAGERTPVPDAMNRPQPATRESQENRSRIPVRARRAGA